MAPIPLYSYENMIKANQQGYMSLQNQSSNNVKGALVDLHENARVSAVCGKVFYKFYLSFFSKLKKKFKLKDYFEGPLDIIKPNNVYVEDLDQCA